MSELSELNQSLAASNELQRELAHLQRLTKLEVAGKYAAAVVVLGVIGLILGLCAIFA